jgi:hypothetical protein
VYKEHLRAARVGSASCEGNSAIKKPSTHARRLDVAGSFYWAVRSRVVAYGPPLQRCKRRGVLLSSELRDPIVHSKDENLRKILLLHQL